MGQQTIPVLKDKFADGKTPPGSDFADLIDSYYHKSTPISQTKVLGLNDTLDKKADKSQVAALSNGIIKQPSVPTFSQLPKNPQLGWDVLVKDQNTRYNWNGTQWVDLETGLYEDDMVSKQTIYNISQENNKFDYANAQIARNAVPANFRTLGLVVSYLLANGEWVTEQYIGANTLNWSVDANWKYLGGLLPEDIYQKVDDTEDKPISPKGVKTGLLGIEGIQYSTETTTGGFDSTNLNDNFTPILGKYPVQGKPMGTSSGHGYTENFIKVTAGETYYCSTDYFANNSIITYSSNNEDSWIKDVALSKATGTFVAPAGCYYIRFIFLNPIRTGGFVVQHFYAGATMVSNDMEVRIGLAQILGAKISTAEIDKQGVFNKSTQIFANSLNDKNVAGYVGSDMWHTDYAPIKPTTLYTSNLANQLCNLWLYDANKNPLYWLGGSSSNRFTTPINAAFVRANLKYSVLAGINIVEGSGANENFTIPNLVISEEMIVKNTGSLSNKEVIARIDTADKPTSDGLRLGYLDQSTLKGKRIAEISFKTAKAGKFVISFASALGSNTLTWAKEITAVVGLNTVQIDKVLPTNEFLQFSGVWLYSDAGANPVGGGANGYPSIDLAVAVSVYQSDEPEVVTHYYCSLGDSITKGVGASSPYPLLLAGEFNLTLNNLAVSGHRVFGGGLLSRVNLVPSGFSGLVTILIGINDFSGNVTLGTVEDALAKSFEASGVNNTFAEAFRVSLETLLRRAPSATVVVMLPLKAFDNKESGIDAFRNVERGIAKYFAVPVIELHEISRIAPLTYSTLMPDKLHPNDAGHNMIKRVLVGELSRFFQFK